MQQLIVIGSGGHSRAVLSTIKLLDSFSLVGIIDINFSDPGECILGIPVLGGLDYLNSLSSESLSLFLAIGDNSMRHRVFLDLPCQNFSFPSIVHPSSIVSSSASFGCGNFIAPNSHLGPEARVGDFSIINTASNVEHEAHVGDFCHLAPNSLVCGRSRIGSSVFCGAGSTIIENISIANSTYLAAGTVLVHSILTSGLRYKGIPGKKF